ncbi:MAG: hypothetical protein P8K79_05240 [Mariniblastus sp.]|nr:hypothetical protein [Mariniblastus sp.]
MSGSLIYKLFAWLPIALLICGHVVAQPDNPLVQDGRRVDEMKRMVNEFINQAQELERQGDRAGAIVLKNKAMGLMKSLRSMNQAKTRPPSTDSNKEPTEVPTVTRAQAVVTLNDCITMLNLLNEKELGRRIRIVMNGIATNDEIQEILDYAKQQKPQDNSAAPTDSQTEQTTAVPKPTPLAKPTEEQVQNQLVALTTSMNALLDADQAEEAKLLARSIMMRRTALQASETTWDYPADYSSNKEIELLRLAGKRLFENGDLIQSKVILELANELDRQKRALQAAAKSTTTKTEDVDKQNQLITRLYQKFEQSEQQRLQFQNEIRGLRRLNQQLNTEIEKLRTKDKQ